MIVLGIDPGTAVTGYGVVREEPAGRLALIECGVIRTRATQPLPQRLIDIHGGIRELIATHRPDAIVLEDVFFAKNARTTVVLGHARGVIMLAAAQQGLPVHDLSPAAIKKAVVGTGAATKAQVQFMVTRLLRLKSAPSPSDAADGVAASLALLLNGSSRIEAAARDRIAMSAAAR